MKKLLNINTITFIIISIAGLIFVYLEKFSSLSLSVGLGMIAFDFMVLANMSGVREKVKTPSWIILVFGLAFLFVSYVIEHL